MTRIGRFMAGLVLVGSTVGTGIGIAVLDGAAAGAATLITVNDASDGSPVPANCLGVEGDCTLRAAIEAANASAGDATITLPDANSVPNSPSGSHIYALVNSNGPLDFSDSGHTITLNGAGETLAIIQMQNEGPVTNRVIMVEAGTTAGIFGVGVEGGDVTGNGGGILNDGTLDLSNSSVTGDTATTGGGIYAFSGAATLTNDTVDHNTTSGSGGAIYLRSGTNAISGGSADFNTSGGAGGGIYVEDVTSPTDSATFTNLDISDNTATGTGGGLYVQNDNDGSSNPVTLTNTTINDNTASAEGGGLYLQNDGSVGGTFTMTGGSVSSNTSGDSGGGIYDQNDGTSNTATFNGVAVNSNSSPTDAGGVYVQNDGTQTTTTFTGGSIDDNSASYTTTSGLGGGVYVQNDGDPSTATFTGGSISGNSAYEGGGVYLQAGDVANFTQETVAGNDVSEAGGGFALDTSQASTTSITSSTVSGNRVGGERGVSAILGDGGGILSFSCNAIALTNDTITGNTAVNGGGYFGTSCAESPTVSTAFEFDTISGNTATDGETGAGNIERIDDSTLTMADSIVANGSASGGPATNCAFTGPGSFTSLGYNLFGDSTCGAGVATDIVGKDPQLGALANNGGPTQTLLPADGSPEVGAIPDAVWVASGVAADQRGVARGAGANSSATIGAVEVGQNFNGYRMVGNEGGIFDFGLLFSGSLANNHLNAPIVGIANAPGPAGYLMAGGDGGVFALGGAAFFGSLGGQVLPSPIAAIAATPTENGYWLIAQNGKIYPFGSVPSLPPLSLPPGAHIVGMASTNTGKGIWAVDQYGDVYAEGDALYKGGLGGVHINAPIVGIAAAAVGQGYVLVASDGGVFNYNMGFYGSVPGSLKVGQHLVAPVVGIAVTHSGKGYWEVGADGGLFDYGDAPFLGSVYTAIPGKKLNGPIVGIQHLGAANLG